VFYRIKVKLASHHFYRSKGDLSRQLELGSTINDTMDYSETANIAVNKITAAIVAIDPIIVLAVPLLV
jgi:hypothetical protein